MRTELRCRPLRCVAASAVLLAATINPPATAAEGRPRPNRAARPTVVPNPRATPAHRRRRAVSDPVYRHGAWPAIWLAGERPGRSHRAIVDDLARRPDVTRFNVGDAGQAALAQWTLLAGAGDRLAAARCEVIAVPACDPADATKRVAARSSGRHRAADQRRDHRGSPREVKNISVAGRTMSAGRGLFSGRLCSS